MGFHWVGMRSALRCLYLAFFTVVASRPNLSTFIIIAKIVSFQSIPSFLVLIKTKSPLI